MIRSLRPARPLTLADTTEAVEAAVTESGRITQHGPSYYLPQPAYVRPFCWRWRIVDESVSPRAVESGWAWTKGRAYKRRHRVYLRLLNGGAE